MLMYTPNIRESLTLLYFDFRSIHTHYVDLQEEVKSMSWEDAVEMLYPNLSTEELEEELMDRIPD